MAGKVIVCLFVALLCHSVIAQQQKRRPTGDTNDEVPRKRHRANNNVTMELTSQASVTSTTAPPLSTGGVTPDDDVVVIPTGARSSCTAITASPDKEWAPYLLTDKDKELISVMSKCEHTWSNGRALTSTHWTGMIPIASEDAVIRTYASTIVGDPTFTDFRNIVQELKNRQISQKFMVSKLLCSDLYPLGKGPFALGEGKRCVYIDFSRPEHPKPLGAFNPFILDKVYRYGNGYKTQFPQRFENKIFPNNGLCPKLCRLESELFSHRLYCKMKADDNVHCEYVGLRFYAAQCYNFTVRHDLYN